MSKKYKILIFRFSSIGDILLTTPIIRCLKTQIPNVEISFVTKRKYIDVIKNNHYIDNIICFDNSVFEVFKKIKTEKYNLIIDLHKNIRTFFLKLLLCCKTITYRKYNFSKYLFINFGINYMPKNHIVDRYLKSVFKIGVKKDNKGLDFFIREKDSLYLKYKSFIDKEYIVICLGGSFLNKRISNYTIKNVIKYILQNTNKSIVLLGGDDVDINHDYLINERVINLVNKTSFNESAFLLKKSFLVITPDTGLMHLASVFNKTIISIWGCTSPLFGFTPYLNDKSFIIIPEIKNHKPCSKHGKYCRNQEFNCIDKIDSKKVIKILEIQIKLFNK